MADGPKEALIHLLSRRRRILHGNPENAKSKPAAWGSAWTSALLCLSAATGYWLSGERGRAICWVVLGVAEVAAIVLW